jgi:hypothetical protein
VCRVALVSTPSGGATTGDDDLVELGAWPRLTAQILRARLETAGIDVLAAWSDDRGPATLATLAVRAADAEFARAVVHEIEVDDEVPDTSPFAYVNRIEEHLSVVGELLEELRSRLDELDADGDGDGDGEP